MIGEPAHQVTIQGDPAQIAQLVHVNVDDHPVLEDELEEEFGPPFWKYERMVRNKLFNLFQSAPENKFLWEKW